VPEHRLDNFVILHVDLLEIELTLEHKVVEAFGNCMQDVLVLLHQKSADWFNIDVFKRKAREIHKRKQTFEDCELV